MGQAELYKASTSTTSSKQDSGDNMCIVCMEEAKSVVLMPCLHMCMCKGCTDQLVAKSGHKKAMCPVCRQLIKQTIKPFM